MAIDGSERGSLDGVPDPATKPDTAAQPSSQHAPGGHQPATSASSFDFNNPTIISLLYLSSFVLGITAIVGVVLAFVWRGEAHEDWEDSHYQYLINTFWIGLVGGIVSMVLMLVLIGFLLIFAVAALVIVRSVLSLINAQKRQPMPNPSTLLA